MGEIEADIPGVIEHSTCLACGCLCDDIRVSVSGGRVIKADRACGLGLPWFLAPRPGEGWPSATVDGEPAEFGRAIGRAAEIMSQARAPVVWGLGWATVEEQAAAVGIADAIGAVVDVAGSDAADLEAFQRVGRVSATLGEVKDRADLVVFWGVDPVSTHPRHFERYSVGPRGRFVAGDRTVVALGEGPSMTAEVADFALTIPPGRWGDLAWALRAMVRGLAVDRGRVEGASGLRFGDLEALAARLMGAQYGAMFHGHINEMWEAEGLLTLVRDLNADARRFVALAMGGPGNAAGAGSVLAWRGGASAAVDFGRGYPQFLPGDATLADRLAAGAVDAILAVGDDLSIDVPPSVTVVRIAPGATRGDRPSAVAFDVARAGIESGGTVARVDGVMLPLRPALAVGLPTGFEVLEMMYRCLHKNT